MLFSTGRRSVNMSFLSGDNDRIPCVSYEACDGNADQQGPTRSRVDDIHDCFRRGGINDTFQLDLVLGPHIRVVLQVGQLLARGRNDIIYYLGTFLRV